MMAMRSGSSGMTDLEGVDSDRHIHKLTREAVRRAFKKAVFFHPPQPRSAETLRSAVGRSEEEAEAYVSKTRAGAPHGEPALFFTEVCSGKLLRASRDSLIRQLDYFLPRMASLAALETRNFTTRLAGILIASPVCGLRPMRALRFASTSFPIPGTTKTFFASR